MGIVRKNRLPHPVTIMGPNVRVFIQEKFFAQAFCSIFASVGLSCRVFAR